MHTLSKDLQVHRVHRVLMGNTVHEESRAPKAHKAQRVYRDLSGVLERRECRV
jgi:hypothetical protein